MKSIVISCFDYTGIMVKRFAEAGYECHIVDLQHPPGKTEPRENELNITKWGMDVEEWYHIFSKQYDLGRVVFASFFPPCTDLAVSGARWFSTKELNNPGTRERAMHLVYWSDKVGKSLGCPYFIENPVSVISTEWRKPDYCFHPYEFGGYRDGDQDGYTKKTCLWTGGNFVMPAKKPIQLDPQLRNKIWYASGPDRRNIRSKTPSGFATAIFEHYGVKKNDQVV